MKEKLQRSVTVFHFILVFNGSGIGEGRVFENRQPHYAQMLIDVQMFNYFRQPCFCQYLVSGS
jgi:hypothetical protein